MDGWAVRRALVASCGALCLVAGLAGCGSDDAPGPGAANVVEVGDGVGLPLSRTMLTAAEQSEAQAAATAFLQQVSAQHPELAALHVGTPAPVYGEKATEPIGAMFRLAFPSVVASIELDLIRTKHNKPEAVASRITNLRALDLIYAFDGSQVIHFGIEPQPGDAADPTTATKVQPLDPVGAADSVFGGTD